jgi:type I restriction enzyme, S subunit
MNHIIPNSWELCTLGEVATINPRLPVELADAIKIGFVPMAAVCEEQGTIVHPEERLYGEVKKGYTPMCNGDVIFAKITPCMENGKSAIVCAMPNGVACGSTEFFVLRPSQATNSHWIHRFIRQASFRQKAGDQMNGAVGQARVPRDFLEQSEIPIAPVAEQGRIVDKLNVLESRTRLARKALAAVPSLLKHYQQSVFASAFRGDLTRSWRNSAKELKSVEAALRTNKVPDRPARYASRTRVVSAGDYALAVGNPKSPLPAKWGWAPLVDVAKLESGHTPSRRHPEWWGGDIHWISIPDARDHHGRTIQTTVDHTNPLGLQNSAARLLPTGTVCLCRTAASIGYVTVLGKPMSTSQDFVNWTCGSIIDPQWLKYLFMAELQSLLRFAKGSTHRTIYFPEVISFHVALPPIEEQREIVRLLDLLMHRIEELTRAVNSGLVDCATLEQSLLAAAFRGELVSQNPNDEPVSVLLERLRSSHAHSEKESRRGRRSRRQTTT